MGASQDEKFHELGMILITSREIREFERSCRLALNVMILLACE